MKWICKHLMSEEMPMSDLKVNVYTPAGNHVGYFLNPEIEAFPENDFEIRGEFFRPDGTKVSKVDVNPEALPYYADLAEINAGSNTAGKSKLVNLYVQRGRQPVLMSGSGA